MERGRGGGGKVSLRTEVVSTERKGKEEGERERNGMERERRRGKR